jgi:murein DD-endopeptidase MepM/ murein hydrolase activator NlpD
MLKRRVSAAGKLRHYAAMSCCTVAAVVFVLAFLIPKTNIAQSPCSDGNNLQDSAFETSSDASGPIVNSFWQSTSTAFGTSLCNGTQCGDGGGTAAPRGGDYWVWFGGTDGPESGTVSQVVTIPAGATAILNYYLWIGGVEAPFTDLLRVVVDGTTVQSIVEPGVAEAGYQFRSVNLSAYADGQSHTISFQYDSPSGGGIANFNLDDITLDVVCATPPAPTAQLANISTRLKVGTGDEALIGGFIISGTQSKKIMVRAIGTSLSALGVPGALGDPLLELRDGSGALIASNDNWQTTQVGGIITASQVGEIQNSGLAPASSAESAVIGTLMPGPYTAIVRGTNNTTGVGLVEVYDLDRSVDSKLGNISTRGFVQTGDSVMIGGVIVVGNSPATVVVRAIGPSLAQAGVPNPLPASTLDLYDGNGTALGSSDNWTSGPNSTWIEAVGLAPGENESAIFRSLLPGQYTAIVRGRDNLTGVAVVETYDITALVFGEATQTSSPQGGTINIPPSGSVTFPPGALPSGQTIKVVALNSFSSAAEFAMVAPLYSASSKLPYEVRINTGATRPSSAVQVSFVVPGWYANSLPPGAGLQAFAQYLEDGGEEILDHFDVCPSTFDPATNTVVANVPPEAFTDGRSPSGAFEAIVTIAAMTDGAVARSSNYSPSSARASAPAATDACEGPIGSPLAQLTITSGFNLNPPGRLHKGIDAHVTMGEDVYAVADGRVIASTVQTCKVDSGCSRRLGNQTIRAAKGEAWGWGQYVIIQHTADKRFSIYAHLEKGSTAALQQGMLVQKGVAIGKPDNSGASFGSHLHFEYLKALSKGQTINTTPRTDPAACINASPTPTPVPCNTTQVAGGDTAETRVVQMGKTAGTFDFSYNTYSIRDRIVVSYEGKTLFDTGCVGESGSVNLVYSGASATITVQVIPNCAGGTSGTAWDFRVDCPM